MSKVAIIQEAPVFLNKTKTIEKAVNLVNQAVSEGAELIVFTEAFIPGYPAWVWRLKPGGDWALSEELHAQLLENSVNLESDDIAPLLEAAKQHQVTIVCGMNEREAQLGRATLYNTVVIIGSDGQLINRHRKLMPTNPERMVWGFGDASGMKVVDTSCGRVGTLPCWENYMPLARYALYAQGIDIYIAPTYDSGDNWIGTLQHIAREGCCWVLGSGNILNEKDIPADLPGREQLYPTEDEQINQGDSIIIAPGGKIIAGPMTNESGILYSEIDLKQVTASRRSLDIVGHYARPDIFTLQVNNKKQSPISFEEV